MSTSVRLRVLPAIPPVDGKSVELRVSGDFIQWRLAGTENGWTNLIALSALTGPQGPIGPSTIWRVNGDQLQYAPEGTEDWQDVIPLADITGPEGGINYLGPWEAGTYAFNSIVESGGSLWFATVETTEEPSNLATDWSLFMPGSGVADGAIVLIKLAPELRQQIIPSFKTVTALLADDNNVVGYAASGADFIVSPGDIIEAQGFRYEVVTGDATDYHLETEGEVRLLVLEATLSPEMLGAAGGAFYAQDAVITAGSTTFVSASANFTSDDVGKVIAIQRAGATGTDTRPMHLMTTIAAVTDANTVTLAVAAGNTVNSSNDDHWRSWGYGTDETEVWQKLVEIGRPIKCRDSKSYFVTEPLGTLTASVNLGGATIIGCYADNDVVAGTESIFYVDGAPDIIVENGKGRWLGYFKKSYVSFVRAIAPRFKIKAIDAAGFPDTGARLGTLGDPGGVYTAVDNEVFDCDFHHNRSAGLFFGNTRDLKVIANRFCFNGLEGDGGTGYGSAALQGSYPLNTLVMGNHSNDNCRKGIDFHGGVGISIIGNYCYRNKVTGIYAEDTRITGSVVIKGNTIGEMTWNGPIASGVSGEGNAPQMFGIMIGAQQGQGTSAAPTNYIVEGNQILNFTMTAEGAFPFYYFGAGLSFGRISFLNNIVEAGNITSIIGSSADATGVGNWYDIILAGNQLRADNCSGVIIYLRGTRNRKKTLSHNHIQVSTALATAFAVNYDSTALSTRSMLAIGNTVDVPATAMSTNWVRGFNDGTLGKAVANIVNGVYAA